MSNSLWPHGLKPTRFLCPWDSPSKNTAVGCHALLQQPQSRVCCMCVCMLSHSFMPNSLWPYGLLWSSVHGIFLARILEWVSISSSRGSSWPRDWNCVSYIPWIVREIPYHRHISLYCTFQTLCLFYKLKVCDTLCWASLLAFLFFQRQWSTLCLCVILVIFTIFEILFLLLLYLLQWSVICDLWCYCNCFGGPQTKMPV